MVEQFCADAMPTKEQLELWRAGAEFGDSVAYAMTQAGMSEDDAVHAVVTYRIDHGDPKIGALIEDVVFVKGAKDRLHSLMHDREVRADV